MKPLTRYQRLKYLIRYNPSRWREYLLDYLINPRYLDEKYEKELYFQISLQRHWKNSSS